MDLAVYYLAFLAFIFVQNGDFLGFPDALDDYLFRGLGGNAAIIVFGLQRKNQLVAKGNIFFDFFSVGEPHMVLFIEAGAFVGLIGRLFFFGADRGAVNGDFDLEKVGHAGREVKIGPNNLAFLAIIFFIGRHQGIGDRLHYFFPGNIAFFLKFAQSGV